MIDKKDANAVRVPPSKRVHLKDYDTRWPNGKISGDESACKSKAEESLKEDLETLSEVQQRLYADDRYSLLVIFQAMDAAGKDGTIKHVMSGVNPQGCEVHSFKQPSHEEMDHNFLWRYMRRLPERGRIGIFNRSYYEDVLVVKVHPEILEKQSLPVSPRADKNFWKQRYEDINAFEEHLSRNGTVILKFFLHISKDEQKRRFLDRLNKPSKNWKFSAADLEERPFWEEYMDAYEAAISATTTDHAPWFIIPADHKWVCRTLVADIITRTLDELDLHYPTPSQKNLELLNAARTKLEKESQEAR
jgi:PPK2 family polyphosphate:nucleotide phosphotransferase